LAVSIIGGWNALLHLKEREPVRLARAGLEGRETGKKEYIGKDTWREILEKKLSSPSPNPYFAVSLVE